MEDITNSTPDVAADNSPSLIMRAQYVKDLSFENPRAPGSIFSLREPPQLEVSVNLGAQRLEPEVFELSIHVSARAIADKTTIFLIDLVYGGIFEVKNIADELLEQTIFVQGGFLLFPYARRVVSDISRDGGFPPLQLEPIDFNNMYAEQRGKAAQA
jgi:preprotein translocase subunit SecB